MSESTTFTTFYYKLATDMTRMYGVINVCFKNQINSVKMQTITLCEHTVTPSRNTNIIIIKTSVDVTSTCVYNICIEFYR